MQNVKDKYYYLYNGVTTVIGLFLLIASLAAELWPILEFLGEYGLSYLTAGSGLIMAVYGLAFYRGEASKNPWIASLLSSMMLALAILILVHDTGQMQSWFMIAWGLYILFSGLFGLYAIVASNFIITLYFVLIATGEAGTRQLDIISAGMVLGSYLLGLVSYVVWRTIYIDPESRKVKQLTGQLKSNQQQAEIIIQSITDGMVVITNDGKISLMNPAASRMTLWDIGEAIGIDANLVLKLLSEDGKELPEKNNPIKQVFSKSETVSANLQLVNRNGKSIIVSVVVSPVIVDKQESIGGAVAVIRDISESRAEEKRRADFISTASHEMRTPVAAIEGYLALALNDRVSSIDEKAKGYLEKAHASTQHLGKLFQDLLTSARAEDGRLVNHPVVIEMSNYLEQLTESLRFAAEKKGLIMDFVIGSQLPEHGGKVIKPLYYVHVDPDRIREVITNVFDNAVKYTESGKISIGLTGNKDVVQMYIKDTGAGIPAEDVPHLFQKFYRVDNSATRTIGGTGLGLFICRKIVELYSGRIWVESEVDKGSTFYINLPRLSSDKASELQAAEASQAPTLNLPK